MRAYIKPQLEAKSYKTSDSFADLWEDIFGTGEEIPVSVYTMSDDSSAA